MKNKKWLDAIGEADEKYIAEADGAHRAKKKLSWQKTLAIAASFLLVFGFLNLYLFLPIRDKAPDVSAYAESEYYGIIQKMSAYNHRPPKHKNNFEKLWNKLDRTLSGMFGATKGDDMNNAPTMDGADMTVGEGGNREVTDNQTAGITEGDLIKRSDRYIYYLDGTYLCVYSIAQEETEMLARFDLASVLELTGKLYTSEWEMYLSEDGKTVTVMAPHYSSVDKEAKVGVISLNVEDPFAIAVREKTFLDGDYISSRILQNGELLLMTRYTAKSFRYDDVSNFVPEIAYGETKTPIAAADIIYPEVLTGAYYTVLLKLDAVTYVPSDSIAFLSYSDEVYVSAEHIFTMRGYIEKTEDGTRVISKDMTEISVLSYLDGAFSFLGSLNVEGQVKDRYSMDEYEGVLRVVTTTNQSVYEENRYEELSDVAFTTGVSNGQGSNANLYLIRLSDRTKIGEVIAFAPPRESVQSVRFDKNAAYVCTSLVLSDPVFFFDLSDPSNITYKDTGTIDGYSTSLVSLGNGFLLGIGYGDRWGNFKCEIYRESANGVISVSKYELENCDFSENYKSYYIDRENGIFGIGVNEFGYSGRDYGYLVLHFDGYDLREIDFLKVYGSERARRGCYIDGYFYAFGQNSFAVHKIFEQ